MLCLWLFYVLSKLLEQSWWALSSPFSYIPTHSVMPALELQWLYHLVKQGADALGADLWLLLFCLISFKLCQLIKDMWIQPWQAEKCKIAMAAPFYGLEIRWVRKINWNILKFSLKFHNRLLFLVCTSAKFPFLKIKIFELSEEAEDLFWCKSRL